MKNRWEITRKFLLVIALLCVIILSAVLFECLLNYQDGIYYREPAVEGTYNKNWLVEESNKTISFPTTVRVEEDEISFVKDIELRADNIIAIPVNRQYVSVSLNDQVVYELAPWKKGTLSSVAGYTAFRVPRGAEGIVRVKLTFSSNRNGICKISSPILIGDDSNVLMYLLKKDVIPIVLLAVIAILAIGLLIFAIASTKLRIVDKRIISLIGLMVAVSIWVFVNLNVLCMFSVDIVWRTTVSFMALLMIPIPVCTYAYYSSDDCAKVILNYFSAALLLDLFFQFLLHYLFGIALYDMIRVTYLLFVSSFLCCVAIAYRNNKKLKDFASFLLLATYVTPTIISFALMAYGILSRSVNPQHIFEAGLAAFIIFLSLDFIYSGAKVFLAKRKLESEVSRYRRLSTKDSLTGLENRRGFDEYIEDMMGDIQFKDALLIFMDLNELKHANDVFGHDAGDDLIRRAASAINEAYSPYGKAFRIGGDEFAAIILDPDCSDDRYMEFLEKSQEARNTNTNITLSIAKGYSHLKSETGGLKEVSLWKSEADNNMYVDKIRTKIRHEEETDEISQEDLDQLTGLLNFTGFKRLAISLLYRNPEQKYALCCYNIKNFKYLNDIYGYDKGDDLLKFWANVISTSLVKGEITCRQNADACISLLKYETENDLKNHFAYVSSMIGKYEDTESFHIAVDAGFYLFDDRERDKPDISRLVDYANTARKTIENDSSSGYCFFNEEMYVSEKRKIRINQTIESAIADGDIRIWVQPQINYLTGKIESGEVLARWNHTELGMIYPDEFVRSLEKSGKIATLDAYIWEEACKVLAKWKDDERFRDASLSVNMSRLDMREVDVVEVLEGLIRKYEIDPKRLRIEITENDYGNSVDLLANVITKLHERGFIVELDDFGSGHLSFKLLEDIDIDIIKIDLKYLSKITLSEKGAAIIKYINEMADLLRVGLIANSVETKQQAEFLAKNGVDVLQGYYFCKPMEIKAFEEFYVCTGISNATQSNH